METKGHTPGRRDSKHMWALDVPCPLFIVVARVF